MNNTEVFDRLNELAHRDEAKALTVRTEDLQALLAAHSTQASLLESLLLAAEKVFSCNPVLRDGNLDILKKVTLAARLEQVAAGSNGPDRALKDALFACLEEGTDRQYGGVLVSEGKYAWVRFTVEHEGRSAQEELKRAIRLLRKCEPRMDRINCHVKPQIQAFLENHKEGEA